MKAKIIPLAMLFACAAHAWGQTALVVGKVVDDRSRTPLVGVNIKLTNQQDTSLHLYATSLITGEFRFSQAPFSTFTLTATHVGYTRIIRVVNIAKAMVDVGELPMNETMIQFGEVVTQGRMPTAIQKADTTEFNAKAFKTNPDASAEELVAKMPGVTVENNTVKSQGEDIQKVLVDGKPFFGNDPTLALRNLPAETIEKIQIFDKQSDQAEFTGFDDGQAAKTMNIVTRPERRNSQFGKTYAGYGNDERYQTGGNINFFRGDMRLSVIGLSNNINQQNFAMQDLLGVAGGGGQRPGLFGGGGRRGGGAFSGPRAAGGAEFSGGSGGSNLNIGNFLVGQQNGVTSTHSVGANFTDTWWDDVQVNQSYFFNVASNGNNQKLRREYLASPDSTTLYNESTNSDSKNFNHRVDTRLQWTIDSSNSLILQPQVYFQENRAASTQLGANTGADASLLSEAISNNQSNTNGYNFTGRLVYRHKFDSPGRTISIDIGGGRNRKDGAGEQQSLAAYYTSAGNPSDTVDQRSALLTNGTSLSSRLVYTEPISEFNQVQVSYSPSWSKNNSDNKKFAINPITRTYDRQIPNLSNSYENTYLTHRVSLGYRLRNADYNATFDVGMQQATLRGAQTYPFAASVEKKFFDILPSASLNYKLSEQTNLRANYRSSTREPSIGQLQNVVDISNPLFVSTGNPDLKQSLTHSLSARFGSANPREAQTLFAVLSASFTLDYIANATITASRDTVVNRGIRLTQGTQLSYPTNLDGYWSLRSFFTYGLPVDLVGSNVNLNAGLSYSRIPGLVNNWRNITHNSALSAGTVVSSNISEDVDFTISYNGTYNLARNTLQADQNSNYYNHSASARASIIFGDGFVFRNETSNIVYTGLSASFDRSYWLWNVSLGKKFFENQRGELRIAVTDLLDQNKSLNRSVTETYIEDTENQILGRFLMVTFTYTVR
jgi:hypothetical protein